MRLLDGVAPGGRGHVAGWMVADVIDESKPKNWVAVFEFPFRTTSHANARMHWKEKSRAVRRERDALRTAWLVYGRPKPPRWPAEVVFTRIAPRSLDCDNLASAFKGMRDELASLLGVDDGSPAIVWRYSQCSPEVAGKRPGYYGVEVDLSCTL